MPSERRTSGQPLRSRRRHRRVGWNEELWRNRSTEREGGAGRKRSPRGSTILGSLCPCSRDSCVLPAGVQKRTARGCANVRQRASKGFSAALSDQGKLRLSLTVGY